MEVIGSIKGCQVEAEGLTLLSEDLGGGGLHPFNHKIFICRQTGGTIALRAIVDGGCKITNWEGMESFQIVDGKLIISSSDRILLTFEKHYGIVVIIQ